MDNLSQKSAEPDKISAIPSSEVDSLDKSGLQTEEVLEEIIHQISVQQAHYSGTSELPALLHAAQSYPNRADLADALVRNYLADSAHSRSEEAKLSNHLIASEQKEQFNSAVKQYLILSTIIGIGVAVFIYALRIHHIGIAFGVFLGFLLLLLIIYGTKLFIKAPKTGFEVSAHIPEKSPVTNPSPSQTTSIPSQERPS